MDQITPDSSAEAQSKGRRRDAQRTREELLLAALDEFSENGFGGARTANIAKRAGYNIRMLYHHFQSKEGVYLAALDRVYAELRQAEGELDLQAHEPIDGILALVDFTFGYLLAHPEFIRMVNIENIQKAAFLKQSSRVPKDAVPLVQTIDGLLKRGEADGKIRGGIDPLQLYISILALSFLHISSKYTLSVTFSQDLGDPEWLAERRRHARDLILAFVALH